MSYQFCILTKSDNRELLELTDISQTGNDSFRTSRGNDFFALPEESGMVTYFAVKKEERILAVIGITEQYRNINAKKEKVFYIHDLRMHPVYGNAMAYYRLITGFLEIYKKRTDCKWMFSSIMEVNPNVAALTKGRSVFPEGKIIGKICHVGLPLFCGQTNYTNVTKITADEAWKYYSVHSQTINFSMADENHFKLGNGFFLGLIRNNKLAAVCKIIDQQSRKIIASGPPAMMQKILNGYCRLKGRKGFPAMNETFEHCHLSYYSSSAAEDHRPEFIRYVRKHFSYKYAYIFTGLLPAKAENYRGKLNIRFHSFLYGYGAVPGFAFQFPELTLI